MFILKRKSAFFNKIQSIEKHASIAICYIGRLYSFLNPIYLCSSTSTSFSIVKVNSGRSITKAEVTLANPYAEVTLANFTSLAYFML